MNASIEAFLAAAAFLAPVLTLVAANVMLALGGERGTLLLPSSGVFRLRARRTAINMLPVARPPAHPQAPANDPHFRRAA